MNVLIEIALFVVLGIIVFQDMKFRAISWLLIPALCIVLFGKAIVLNETDGILFNITFNIVFVLIQLLLLTIYISIKNKKMTNIINSYLGIGDILFFVAIGFAFSPLNYILFYVISMVLTMLLFVSYKTVKKNISAEIPLAGGMAGMMIVLNVVSMIQPQFNYYADTIFSSLIIQ